MRVEQEQDVRLSRVPILAAVVAFVGGAVAETIRERESVERKTTRHVVARPRPRQDLETEAVHGAHGSIWPAALGAGVTLLAFGVLTSYAFSAVGMALFLIGLAGWIGELRRE